MTNRNRSRNKQRNSALKSSLTPVFDEWLNPSDLRTVGLPSTEHAQHDLIERSEATINEHGRLSESRPYKSVDILVRMHRRGSITIGMRRAGEDFRDTFRCANIDPLAAIDLSRPFIDSGHRAIDRSNLESKNDVWQALLAAGGLFSPGGSCLWHVIGFEWTLKEWAMGDKNGLWRKVSQETAYGILIAALGALESYYRRGGIGK